MPRVSILLFMPLLFTLGCSPDVTLNDDIDLEFDFFMTPSNHLNTPYVLGAEIRISAVDDDGEHDRWRLRSADDMVFRTLDARPGATTFLAASAGKTSIRATPAGGSAFNAGRVEVASPDRVTVTPHGPLIIGRREPPVQGAVHVLIGGRATFLVRYFSGQRELHGNGVLSATSSSDITITPRTTFLFERREWLTVSPQKPGRHVVRLFAAGRAVGELTVIGVGDDAIEAFALAAESERGAKNGHLLTILAEAFDIDGNSILGIEPEWELDGLEQFGEGDLFRYTFDRGSSRRVSAHLGPHESQATIRAEDGFVASSNDIGCAGGTQAMGASLIACMLLLYRVRSRRVA